ncbi:MAG: NAD(P)(+) transhydrogenase (Re/Si-specific) subunit beta [Phycisphaerales bacterium JB050]
MNTEVSGAQVLMILACSAFIIGLKLMGRKESSQRGNLISAAGMLAAVVGALWESGAPIPLILGVVGAGSIVGVILALRVRMTSMPELVAVFNGLGGLASLCVGLVGMLPESGLAPVTKAISAASILIGGIAFSGSLIAYGKLAGRISTAATVFRFQLTATAIVLLVALGIGAWAVVSDAQMYPAYGLAALSLLLGVLSVVRIGGGDMPVVVSLLNSYSGIAAALAGTAIASPTLMIAGALVGASGFMLTRVMCKSMNRSLANVLFGGFGVVGTSERRASSGTVSPVDAADAYLMLEAARSVVIVPGYGMAVAKAQHALKELSDLLIENGTEVRFVIHPIAGRMPGHMNVLLAEAGISYELLAEPQDVNETMGSIDVALVIGANDVVNPDARTEPSSPLFGMPIVNVDLARTVIVSKRSMASGFAGVDNALFTMPNTRMLFGDAKASISGIVEQFSS